MCRVWKIAPGTGGADWSVFRQNGCISLGWLELPDYQQYTSQQHVLEALRQTYGENVYGCGSGAATQIWRFVDELEVCDIVVANAGYKRVVGIGMVTSDYIAPTQPLNPLLHDTTTHRHHVRRVDWLIPDPVVMPANRFFVQSALWPMDEPQLQQVLAEYRTEYPYLQPVLDQLRLGRRASICGTLPDEVQTRTLREGATRHVTVNVYERNPEARRRCIEAHGTCCCVCGFSFGDVYGPEAEGYIHVHHLRPLSEIGAEYVVDPVQDLRPVCPNCHAMLHLGGGCRSIDDIRRML
jgi:5-methylcytosine-specific restriction endonuclease McrA